MPPRAKSSDRVDLLQGTLDLQKHSDDLLLVEHGSLYPALHRLVRKRWLAAEWQDTPKGRPMKFYRLTPAGRRQLVTEESNWQRLARAIGLVLKRA
jgi:PadR family transcriptional regulator, regulatory protein PadR